METTTEEAVEATADTERETTSDVAMVALMTSARLPVRQASRTTTASSPAASNAASWLVLLSLKHGGGTVIREGSCRLDEKACSHCEQLFGAICGMKELPQSPSTRTVMLTGISCRTSSHSDALSYARLGVTSAWMLAAEIPSRVFVTARARSLRRSVACDCSCRCSCTSVHISAELFSSRLNGGSDVASSTGDISTVNSM